MKRLFVIMCLLAACQNRPKQDEYAAFREPGQLEIISGTRLPFTHRKEGRGVTAALSVAAHQPAAHQLRAGDRTVVRLAFEALRTTSYAIELTGSDGVEFLDKHAWSFEARSGEIVELFTTVTLKNAWGTVVGHVIETDGALPQRAQVSLRLGESARMFSSRSKTVVVTPAEREVGKPK